MPSIVYVLTNPAMPGLVKIGQTSAEEAAVRLAQLYSTGVPFPFNLEYAAKVNNPGEVENALHRAFAPNRVNPRREFFSIEAEQVIAILKLLHIDEVTSELQQTPAPSQVTAAEITAGNEYERQRRPKLNFVEMGIPIGSTLLFKDGVASALVASPKKVKVGEDGEELSLTALTQSLLGIERPVQPSPYWSFNGRSVLDIMTRIKRWSELVGL
jgi:hypothetical protein